MTDIKTLDDLKDNISAIDDVSFLELVEYVKENYNFGNEDAKLNITSSELEYLNSSLAKSDDQFQCLKYFIDDEIKQTKTEKELSEINQDIQQIDKEISENNYLVELYSIIVWDFKDIKHWDDIFNIWDINDIKVYEVIHNNTEDFSAIISDTIWFNDYQKLPISDKKILDLLLKNIRDFHLLFEIEPEWELKHFIKIHKEWFTTFLQEQFKHV